jgi:peptide/nickel transport system permease protein
LSVVALFIVIALLAPLIAPFDPSATDLTRSLQAPSAAHLMGTDKLGRDELSRVVYGARISLVVGVVAVLGSVVFGGLMGALAGGFGGRVDTVVMRSTDALLAVPGILLAIGIIAWLGRGLPQILLAVAATNAPVFARLLRGSLLALRGADFVIAARTFGGGRLHLLVRHMLPNALTPVIVQATLSMAVAVIDVAALGFLGLGPPDPGIAEWGTMLTSAGGLIRVAPWLVFFPGLAIVMTVMGFNLLGDGLRESLDPRFRR